MAKWGTNQKRSTDWRTHFPGTPREGQATLLDVITSEWDNYDAFVVVAPPGAGKSRIAATLMSMHQSSAYIVPNNALLEQVSQEFPSLQTVRRLDTYQCPEWKAPCIKVKAKCGAFCSAAVSASRGNPPCQASQVLRAARYYNGPILSNYHGYLAHRIRRDLLIVDEAHLLRALIAERDTKYVWRHRSHFPKDMWTQAQIFRWVSQKLEDTPKDRVLRTIHAAIESKIPKHIVTRTYRESGKDKELKDCLAVEPVDVSGAPEIFWGGAKPVKKMVLMSATLSRLDIDALGLRRTLPRVLMLEVSSEVHPESRPIYSVANIHLTYQNYSESIPRVEQAIRGLAAAHPEERGVVHTTYRMAEMLRPLLSDDPRYLFHDRQDKRAVYAQFRSSSPGTILVACGMYEGIDLPGECARWQVITKVPWASLGNPAIKYLCTTDEAWYSWDALRAIIQASGRVVRGAGDWGVTYIIDRSWDRLYNTSIMMGLVPDWFKAGVEIGRINGGERYVRRR